MVSAIWVFLRFLNTFFRARKRFLVCIDRALFVKKSFHSLPHDMIFQMFTKIRIIHVFLRNCFCIEATLARLVVSPLVVEYIYIYQEGTPSKRGLCARSAISVKVFSGH